MADTPLTLLEITKRSGTDAMIGLVEDVATFAPEMAIIPGRTIKGISYDARVRTALNAKGAFRNANTGVEIGSDTFEKKRFDCYFFDTQLQVDEAVLKASGINDSEEMVLADAAAGAFRGGMITLGKQFIKGTNNSASGHLGLQNLVNTALTLDATGAGGTTYRAWFIRTGPQGVHYLFGNEQGLQIGPWSEPRQVYKSANSWFTGRTNSISGYLGLSCAGTNSVGYIKNLTSAKPLTDALVAELMTKFPVGQKPNLCLIERNSAFWLQRSRAATSVTNAATNARKSDGTELWPGSVEPTSVLGVPIVVTDSVESEAAF